MRRWLAIVLGVAATILALPAQGRAQTTEQRLQAVLDRTLAERPQLPGIVAYVSAPGLEWRGAAGHPMFGSLDPVHPDATFRIASSHKPFTAAAVMRLAEKGRLGLSDPISRWLPESVTDRISVSPAAGRAITVEQLLTHMSGINSHDEDPLFLAEVGARPTKDWTAQEQIEIAIRMGPLDPPGTTYHYSDTGFVMLGLIIAEASGRPLAQAMRGLLRLEKLELPSTYYEYFESAPLAAQPRMHHYFGVVDTYFHNPSFDTWGGGGYVSSARDLAAFIRALFGHRVVGKATLRTMLETKVPTNRLNYAVNYGLGLGEWRIAGHTCWGHPGFWGSSMYYCPKLDLAFATMNNQGEEFDGRRSHLRIDREIVEIVAERHAPAR